MVDAVICTPVFENFMNNTIVPLVLFSSIATSALIALSYMVGNAISNAKLTFWAKTEAVQIVISAMSIVFILATVNGFCSINMGELSSFFTDIDTPQDLNLFDAAQEYLRETMLYSHNAMTAVRYHLEGYTVLSFLNSFSCDFKLGPIGLGCLHGYSGTSGLPVGGYGAIIAALNIFFNSTIMSYFSAMNYLFILLFVYKGFVFLFLPVGIFVRSLPYLRSFGSVLIAIALSFLLVFPFMLSIFYLMGDVLLDRGNNYEPQVGNPPMNSFYYEKRYPDNEYASIGTSIAGEELGVWITRQLYFPSGENPGGAIIFAAYAFLAAVFMPTAALIATIASVSYISRLYGEEIDLSRITMMV